MNGIEDTNATVESIIVVFDYLSFVYICIGYTRQVAELGKIFNDIVIFLEFCDISVIENAENDVHFYTKGRYTFPCLLKNQYNLAVWPTRCTKKHYTSACDF